MALYHPAAAGRDKTPASSPLKKSEACRFRQKGRMAPRIAKRSFLLGQLTGGGLGKSTRDDRAYPQAVCNGDSWFAGS